MLEQSSKMVIIFLLVISIASRPLEAPKTLQDSLEMSVRSIFLNSNISPNMDNQHFKMKSSAISRYNYSITLKNRYIDPVFMLGMTSFGTNPSFQQSTSDGQSFKVEFRGGEYETKSLNIQIAASGQIKLLKICYLALSRQASYEIGLYHHSYQSSHQIKQWQQNNIMELSKQSQENAEIELTLILKDIHKEENSLFRSQKLPLKIQQREKPAKMKAISFLRQYQYIEGRKTHFKLETSVEDGVISVIFSDQLAQRRDFPQFTLALLIQNKHNAAINLQRISVSYLPDISQRLSTESKIGFIGLSAIENRHQCQEFSLLNTLLNEDEGYFINFQDKNTNCVKNIQFSMISFDLDQMQASQSKISPRMLLTCTGAFYPTYYQNYWLQWIDPVLKTVETCQACPAGCLTCQYCQKCYRKVTCNSCVAGTQRKPHVYRFYTMYVCRCPTNYWINATNNLCYLCNVLHPGCGADTCTGVYTNHYTSLCTTCNPGYYGPVKISIPYWIGYISCGQCPAGCSSCTNAISCTTCFGTTLVNINGVCYCKTALTYYSSSLKSCVNCDTAITKCWICDNITTSTTCTQCKVGYYLSSPTTCTACQINCNTCTATLCTSCQSPYIPSGSSCVCNSSASMVYETSSSTCVLCSSKIADCMNCTSGTITCTNCQTGYYLQNSTSCALCPTTCSACNTSVICTDCANNLILALDDTCGCNITNDEFYLASINQCVVCSSFHQNCQDCINNVSSSTVECLICDTGYYLQSPSTGCVLCPIECSSCTSLSNCTTSCNSGYIFNNATQLCDCENCTYCDTVLSLPNCAICDIGPPVTCTLCVAGSYSNTVNGSQTCESCPIGCASCADNTTCNNCLYPFVASATSGCQCNPLSLEYYDPATLNCSSCIIIISYCHSCESSNYVTVCTDCWDGYYFNGTTCQPCISPCSSCTNETACLTCIATFTLSGTQCICDETQAMFFNVNTNSCLICQGFQSSACLVCDNQTLATNGVKCITCIDGYFADSNTYECSNCPQACKTCLSFTLCITCINSYEIINGSCSCDIGSGLYPSYQTCAVCSSIINYCTSCQYLSEVTTCLDCNEGAYLAADQKSCILCPSNCEECDITGCLTCAPGFYSNGTGLCHCLTTCADVSMADPNCLDCSQTIDPLTNVTNTLCYACSISYYNSANESCNNCPSTCLTCNQYLSCAICQPSFTLIDGQCICDYYSYQILYQSYCHDCSVLITGCQKCSFNATLSCTYCIQGYVLIGGACSACQVGCLICDASLVCQKCMPDHTLNTGICSFATCDPTNALFYQSSNSTCLSCHSKCIVCTSYTQCLTCITTIPNLKNIGGTCKCAEELNYFYNDLTLKCTHCLTLSYLINCLFCAKGIMANQSQNIICTHCLKGYYLTNSVCSQCQAGCINCVDGVSCCSCDGPKWTMNSSVCVCNNLENYFPDNASDCQVCTLSQCSICTSLTECFSCNFGYYVNNVSLCQPIVCGNGDVEGIQPCDDGNNVNGDGCDENCTIQTYYFCQNSPSVCEIDNRFNVKISSINVDCNQITYQFVIYQYYSFYDNADYSPFLVSQDVASQNLIQWKKQKDSIYYTYQYNAHLQNLTVNFVFDSQYLGINETSTYPRNTVTFVIQSTNNVKAFYYEQSVCQSKQSFTAVQKAIEYSSYGILILSSLPCKIIGLELLGVLQLAFISLGSLDSINMLLSPMTAANGVNGFNVDLSQSSSRRRLLQTSSSLTPQRVASIGYKANFIRNCNVMLLLVVTIIFVSLVLYLITFFLKSCLTTLHKVSKRLIKEVLLTLVLFNIFNFSYSAGLHFKYAESNDQLYTLGTIAAIAALVIPFLIVLSLMLSEQEGFGQFKDKLKRGCVQKGYFVVTIFYRIIIGLYLSTSNQDELSTLIVLGFSILFLMYNLVNLPFSKAYHNYRANVCHFCQFICLFIIMYYRSMKSSTTDITVSTIFAPVYIWYVCIIISLVVSLIVLIYELYVWIKQCMISNHQQRQLIHQKSQCNLKELNPTIYCIEDKKQIYQVDLGMYE